MGITVTLPDGKALELPDGATGADAAAAIGPGLARAALAVEVSHPEDGEEPEVRDLARALPDGAHVAIVTAKQRRERARADPPRRRARARRPRCSSSTTA